MPPKHILLGCEGCALTVPLNFFSNPEKFALTMVRDGEEAIRHLAEKKPDLAILDLDLAKKGGDECCKEAKQASLSPGTSIVLMVHVHSQNDIRRSLDAQCDALLAKPVAYVQLAGITTRLLFHGNYATPRFEIHLPVQYGIQPHKMVNNYSVDLSTGGIFVEAERIVPVGTLLNVSLTLPNNGTRIDCTARVAWLNGPVMRREPLLPTGMGLQFVDMDNRGATAITEFLYSDEAAHFA